MLINCPKCGFSQPKDRYCASCGVDMEAYRPPKKSMWAELWMNPVFLVSLTLLLVMTSVFYIRKKQKDEVAGRAEMLRSGPTILETTTNGSKARSANPVGGAAPAGSTTGSSPALPPAAVNPPGTAPAAAKTPEPAKSDAKNFKIVMSASYAEVSKQAIQAFEEEAQNAGQFTDFGEFKAGALPEMSLRLASHEVKVLQKITKTFDSKSLQQQWFVGNKINDDQELGLTTLLIMEASTDTHNRGEIEILRSFRESADSEDIQKHSYPVSRFDLPPKWGWMIHLKLPNIDQSSPDESFGTEGLLRIFKSGAFKKGETEFTLMLDFDSPSP